MPPKNKNICFTTYDIDWKPEGHPKIKYCVWQKERCPTTGKTHLQGYAELTEYIEKWDEMKSIFGNAHIETRKGSQKQAIAYCQKKETQLEPGWEYGHKARQGERNDLNALKTILDEGGSLRDIANENFNAFIRYNRGFDRYKSLLEEHRTKGPNVVINWGVAGKGKTRDAVDFSKNSYYIKDPSHKWWDGYEQQHVVIIDDYDDKSVLGRNFLLMLFDRYKMEVEVKGGTRKFNSAWIYITSNTDPRSWKIWDEAIERRITQISEFSQ